MPGHHLQWKDPKAGLGKMGGGLAKGSMYPMGRGQNLSNGILQGGYQQYVHVVEISGPVLWSYHPLHEEPGPRQTCYMLPPQSVSIPTYRLQCRDGVKDSV